MSVRETSGHERNLRVLIDCASSLVQVREGLGEVSEPCAESIHTAIGELLEVASVIATELTQGDRDLPEAKTGRNHSPLPGRKNPAGSFASCSGLAFCTLHPRRS